MRKRTQPSKSVNTSVFISPSKCPSLLRYWIIYNPRSTENVTKNIILRLHNYFTENYIHSFIRRLLQRLKLSFRLSKNWHPIRKNDVCQAQSRMLHEIRHCISSSHILKMGGKGPNTFLDYNRSYRFFLLLILTTLFIDNELTSKVIVYLRSTKATKTTCTQYH